MKKYLSLFVVLLMAFVINTNLVKAEDDATVEKCFNPNDPSSNPLDKCNDSERREAVEIEIGKKIRAMGTIGRDIGKVEREKVKKQIESIREEAKTKIEALRENIKNEKDAEKAKIKEIRITGREKALERFDNTIERINKLEVKINAQIVKLEVKGVNVTNAKNFVTTAEAKLVAAKNKIAEINTLLASSINELTLENKTKLRTLTTETQTLINEAHKALQDAVKSLKVEVKIKLEVKTNDQDNND